MAIFIIRHGETALGAAGIIQRPETPLSDRGRSQASRLSRRLAELEVGRILSSDLRRAEMTAEPVARETGLPIELEPLLQERNFGDLRGMPYAELSCDPFAPDSDPPGGETWEVFHARVDAGWDRLREAVDATQGNLAVVTHGLVCRSLVTRCFALEEVLNAMQPREAYFWAVHGQAELDLLIMHKGKRLGFEFKFADAPRVTRSMRTRMESSGAESKRLMALLRFKVGYCRVRIPTRSSMV